MYSYQPQYGYPQPSYAPPQGYAPQYGYPGAPPPQAYYGQQQAYPQQTYPQQPYMAQPAYGYAPQSGYPAPPVAAVPMAAAVPTALAAPLATAAATPVISVFTVPTTFQVRKNYMYKIGKGEMDIFLNGRPYFRLLSNPAPNHAFGWGHNYALYDLFGNNLAYIEQEVHIGMPHFHIYVRGVRYGKLRKEFTILKKVFHLTSESGEAIRIKGDWFSMTFRFTRSDGKQAAVVMGNASNDMYDVTVQPGEDSLFILLAVMTVEKLCRDGHDNRP